MSSAFKLFSVRGIAIRVHITFPLILIWAAVQFGFLNDGGLVGALFGVIITIFLFVIVTLHELGHSVAAQGYGVPVKQIVLLPIGGVAQLQEIPENPIQELVIAIAGPAVNFILAVLLGIFALLPGLNFVDPSLIFSDMSITLPLLFTYVFIYNLFLGIFNLLPAFPMDGGRVLRALLATRLNYLRATSIAVSVGQGMAWLLGLYGFISGNYFLILIAFFVYMGAGQEEQLVRVRTILRGVTVRQAYSQAVNALRPDDTLQDAINLTLQTLQASFPVMDGERVLGMLPYVRLVEALNEQQPTRPISEVMVRDVEPAHPDDEIFDVQQRLKTSKLDALPVIADGRCVGMITTQDIGEVYRLLSIDPDLLPGRELPARDDAPYAPLRTGG